LKKAKPAGIRALARNVGPISSRLTPLADDLFIESRIVCGHAVDGVRFWHCTLVLGRSSILEYAANRERKRKKHPSERRVAIIGIRTATPQDEVNAHDVNRGTF